MRTLVIGAGAIGAFLAGRFALSGQQVGLYGRGAGMAVLARDGIRLSRHGAEASAVVARPACYTEVPPADGWDLVIFAVKAQDLPAAARQFSEHVKHAVVLLPQNGLAWWHFLAPGGIGLDQGPSATGRRGPGPLRLKSVDPDGWAEQALPLDRIAGCVVSKGLMFVGPGELREAVVPGDQFCVGDVLPGSGAAQQAEGCLRQAGLPTLLSDDIREEKWRKLMLNVAFNPLGALSRLGFGQIVDIGPGRRLVAQLIGEAVAVGRAYGMRGDISLDAIFARAESSRHHKTSMLQDVEAGKRLEIAPILGSLLELAGHRSIAVPGLQVVHDCLCLVEHGLQMRRGEGGS